MRVCLVGTVKNEGPYLLEWVAWNRLAGFTDLVVAQNDSFDGSDAILQELERIDALTFIENSGPGDDGALPQNYQWRAYHRAARTEAYRRSDWVFTGDCDEFLDVTVGEGRVQDLLRAIPDPMVTQIHICWHLFGSSGHRRFVPGLAAARFVEADAPDRIRREPLCFKTLFRRDAFEMPGIHRPYPIVTDPAGRVTGSGLPLQHDVMDPVKSRDPGAYALARVVHYRCRDLESFLLGQDRGFVERRATSQEIRLGYWAVSDRVGPIDRRLADRAPDILREMALLDRRSGGRLWALTREAGQRWRARIDALKDDPVMSDLYERAGHLQRRFRTIGGEDARGATIRDARRAPAFMPTTETPFIEARR